MRSIPAPVLLEPLFYVHDSHQPRDSEVPKVSCVPCPRVKMQRVEESMDSLAFSSKPSSPVGRGGKQGKTGAKAEGFANLVPGSWGSFWWFLFIFIFGEARK